MEQRRLAPYISSPSQGVLELPLPYEPYRCDSLGPATPESHNGSFDEHARFHGLPHGFTGMPTPREPEHSFEPWLMDLPPSTNPISMTSSSLSPSVGGISTPYADTPFPLYHLLEQSLPLRSSSSTSNPTWANGTEASWPCQYTESNVWSNQALPSPAWSGDGYGLPLPPMNDNNMPVLSQNHTDNQSYLEGELCSPGLFKPEETDSSDESDSDSSDTECEDDESSDGRHKDSCSSKHRSARQKSPLVKVNRWDVQVDTFAQHETRHYVCNFAKVPDENGEACDRKFVRPEHLRRHLKTVHSDRRDYSCKVPNCYKPFSRGDNLREHYWTHLARGGRTGKNFKMTLPELKAILGPKERKLIRRLKHKLNTQKIKAKL